MLKKQVDDHLRKVYELTEAIKKLEPEIKLASAAAKKVFIEILYEYKSTYSKTRELLGEYIREEREKGITSIELSRYVKLHREKFGEENYESTSYQNI